jgi:hypothetical protein
MAPVDCPVFNEEMTLKNIIWILALSLLTTTAQGDWAIRGEGNFSCPDYVQARRLNSKELFASVSWVQGFVTGVNFARANASDTDSFVGRDFPTTSIVNWLEDYCRDNPQDYLSDAAEALFKDLENQ